MTSLFGPPSSWKRFNIGDWEEGKSSSFRYIWRREAGLFAFCPCLVSWILKSTSLKTSKVFERSNARVTYIYIYIYIYIDTHTHCLQFRPHGEQNILYFDIFYLNVFYSMRSIYQTNCWHQLKAQYLLHVQQCKQPTRRNNFFVY